MTMIRKVVPAALEQLGDDEVLVRMSTGALARDGHILVPAGAQLDNYRRNPIVLWQHDPSWPVAKASDIGADAEAVTARVTFAPTGVSKIADETRGLVKAGIVNAVSVGFDPIDGEPLDPKKPKGGQRFTRWELLECSFVSVPADTGAVVTARDYLRAEAPEWKVGTARDLPIEDSDEWDGAAAQKSIFDWAANGGDDFDPVKARRAFLAYDAANPGLKGSYKLPIAHAVGGELRVPKQAIRAAASRLPQSDLPQTVMDEAETVLDHYKEKAGIGDGNRGRRPGSARSARRFAAPDATRGLNHVAMGCWMLDLAISFKESVEVESVLEGDASAVPAMAQELVDLLCEILETMVPEETGEIKSTGADEDVEVIEMQLAQKHIRAALANLRAGAAAGEGSAAGRAAGELRHALRHHNAALGHHRALGERHRALAGEHEEALGNHGRLGDHLDAAQAAIGADNPEASEALDRALRSHEAMRRNLDAVTGEEGEIERAHEALGEAHRNAGIHMRAAQRDLAALDDGDGAAVQASDGIDDSDGSDNGRAARQQIVRRHLAAARIADIAAP